MWYIFYERHLLKYFKDSTDTFVDFLIILKTCFIDTASIVMPKPHTYALDIAKNVLTPSATGDTVMYDSILIYLDDITVHVVPREHFFKIF